MSSPDLEIPVTLTLELEPGKLESEKRPYSLDSDDMKTVKQKSSPLHEYITKNGKQFERSPGWYFLDCSKELRNLLRALVHCEAKRLSTQVVGSSRVDLQACKLEYSIVSPK